MKAETATITIPVTALEMWGDKDIELESTLADYLPNINRIIRADADLTCEDIQISGNKAEVNGKAVFTLLYQSDFKDKLCHERFSTDFVQKFDLRDLPEGDVFPKAAAKCSYVGCKTLNPRRFILRCRADVKLELKCMQKLQAVSAEDCKGAFFKTEKREIAVYCPDILRDFKCEESLGLETMPPIGEIIYTSLDFSAPEISKSDGSALIRSEACFKCLYETEEENTPPQMLCRRFPAVFTVDDELIKDDSKLFASLGARGIEAEKDIDAYGENRVIQLSYGARLCIGCINRKELCVPTDMFFTEYNCEGKCQAIPYEAPAERLRHRLTLDKIVEGEMNVDSCIDANADLCIDEATPCPEGINVKGNCNVNVFGVGGEGYRAKDFKIPFSETLPFKLEGKDCEIDTTVLASTATAEIVGGRLALRISAELALDVSYKEKLCFLSSADIEKRSGVDEDKCVIIYYPQKGECAWDIAKRYYIDPKTLRENNAAVFDKNDKVADSGTIIYM